MTTPGTAVADVVPVHERPFPGMRPFERHEADLFFGQDEQITALVQRLGHSRLLAVLGESGCGKSSLVKAGMIPKLLGRNQTRSAFWRISISRPGTSPIAELARCLSSALNAAAAPADAKAVELTLRASSYGLVDAVRAAGLPRGHRVLVVVDQFEELFRYWREAEVVADRDEAALFVKLLLAACETTSDTAAVPIYVTLTMRSEYLGDCALFFGLAEAINEGAYLLPKMMRSNVEEAIQRPLALFGASMANELRQTLLNEAEVAQQDGLPMMQHALTRMWDTARARKEPGPVRLELKDLQAVPPSTPGTLFIEKHLNAHLDSLWAGLAGAPERRRIVEALFKQLGDFDAKGRLVRRPSSLADAGRVCRATPDAILEAVTPFRDHATGQSFLMPPLDRTEALRAGDDDFGICHEALLRHWATFGGWLQQEAKDAEAYRALAGRAVAVDKPNPLRGAELRQAEGFRKRVMSDAWCRRYQGPHDARAERYQYDYAAAMAYLARSRRLRLLRRSGLAVAAVVALVLSMKYVHNEVTARDTQLQLAASQQSEREARAAKDALVEAVKQREDTNTKLQTTVAALETSQAALGLQIGETRAALAEAQRQKHDADVARDAAEQRRFEATALRETAEQRLQQATEARNALAVTARQLEEANKRIEASAAQRTAEQDLRLFAAREPVLRPGDAVERLTELTAQARAYATKYGELPTPMFGALKQALALSYLRDSDTQSSAPVILATALPEQSRLLVVRRGEPPSAMGASVPRSEWSFQRAALAPTRNELIAGGAGGFVTLAKIGRNALAEVTRKLHPFAVTGLGFSTDGDWVATASAAGDMRLLHRESLARRSGGITNRILQMGNVTKLVTFLVVHSFKGDYAVRDFALSVAPGSKSEKERRNVTVVALTEAGRAIRWARPGPFGKQIGNLDQMSLGTFTAVATNPASQEVWLTGERGLNRLPVSSQAIEPCYVLPDLVPASALAWNTEGTRLAAGFRDGSIRVLAKPTPAGCEGFSTELVIPAHTTAITTLAWQGDQLASGASDGAARLWALPDPEDRRLLGDIDGLATEKGKSSGSAVPVDGAIGSVLERLSRRSQALQPAR